MRYETSRSADATERDKEVNLHYEAQRLEYESIADRIAGDTPKLTLDWGCGWGQVSDLLVRRGLAVELYDYDGPGAPEAEMPLEHYPELKAFLSAEAIKLPYENSRFDAVLSCGVLEHVREPESSLDELRRILAPGGRLYIYKLPNRHSYLEWIAKRLGWYFHGKEPFDTLYTLDSAIAMVSRHGFEVQSARLANMLPLTAGGTAANRIGKIIWALNTAIAKIPVLKLVATNVELIAIKSD